MAERTFCISFSPVRSVISILKNIILFKKKTDIQNTMNLMVGQPTKEALKTCLYVLNKQDQVNNANSAFILKNLLISRAHGTRTCIKRQKIAYGKFFDFWADEYIYKRIPEDENPPMKGF